MINKVKEFLIIPVSVIYAYFVKYYKGFNITEVTELLVASVIFNALASLIIPPEILLFFFFGSCIGYIQTMMLTDEFNSKNMDFPQAIREFLEYREERSMSSPLNKRLSIFQGIVKYFVSNDEDGDYTDTVLNSYSEEELINMGMLDEEGNPITKGDYSEEEKILNQLNREINNSNSQKSEVEVKDEGAVKNLLKNAKKSISKKVNDIDKGIIESNSKEEMIDDMEDLEAIFNDSGTKPSKKDSISKDNINKESRINCVDKDKEVKSEESIFDEVFTSKPTSTTRRKRNSEKSGDGVLNSSFGSNPLTDDIGELLGSNNNKKGEFVQSKEVKKTSPLMSEDQKKNKLEELKKMKELREKRKEKLSQMDRITDITDKDRNDFKV